MSRKEMLEQIMTQKEKIQIALTSIRANTELLKGTDSSPISNSLKNAKKIEKILEKPNKKDIDSMIKTLESAIAKGNDKMAKQKNLSEHNTQEKVGYYLDLLTEFTKLSKFYEN